MSQKSARTRSGIPFDTKIRNNSGLRNRKKKSVQPKKEKPGIWPFAAFPGGELQHDFLFLRLQRKGLPVETHGVRLRDTCPTKNHPTLYMYSHSVC